MHEDAREFDVFYGTNFYKPRELINSFTPCHMTPAMMRAGRLHGSFEADSYSAGLICAALVMTLLC